MNDKLTISTAQLLAMFPDEAAARAYIESRRWPNGPRCPVCDSDNIGQHSPGIYRCNACREPFTCRTGTIFERSHIPLQKWLHAMYLLVTSRKGISSMQLSKELSVTQKSAWFLLQRLRAAHSEGNCKRPTLARLDAMIAAAQKRRITYEELTR